MKESTHPNKDVVKAHDKAVTAYNLIAKSREELKESIEIMDDYFDAPGCRAEFYCNLPHESGCPIPEDQSYEFNLDNPPSLLHIIESCTCATKPYIESFIRIKWVNN